MAEPAAEEPEWAGGELLFAGGTDFSAVSTHATGAIILVKLWGAHGTWGVRVRHGI